MKSGPAAHSFCWQRPGDAGAGGSVPGMKSDFLSAIALLAAEKNLPKEKVFEAVETALAAAYKKDNYPGATISVKINPETGMMRTFSHWNVVEEVENADEELTLKEARKIQPDARLGETVAQEIEIKNAGRIQAQTAKQVVLQRLRETEREAVYEEYSGKEGDIISGVIQRLEGRNAILDLGKTEALLPGSEQVRVEHYRPAQRIKVLVVRVDKAVKGPQVIVSRAHRDLIKRLFELEVPEIHRGTVEIKSIAREPGFRSKVAVYSREEGVDPVGACVGLRGIRIQNIVNELGGERIDVVQWDPDPAKFVANALSPAQVLAVRILPDGTTGEAVVGDRQLSLAIGKEGQNARLAAKLTGLRIDIKSQSAAVEGAEEGEVEEPTLAMSAEPDVKRETPIWEELAAAEAEEKRLEEERRLAPAVAAQLTATEGAPVDDTVLRPAATTAERPGAVRFANEVMPRVSPDELTRGITGGGRRRGGGGGGGSG